MTLDNPSVLTDTENPVLQACAASTRLILYERSSQVRFEPDTILFADGDEGGMVLLPVRGALQMGKATARGRRQIICNPTAHSCGGICMLAFGDRALAEARGLEAGEVLVIRRSDFEQIIHADPLLCRAAWHSAASCMAHLSDLVAQLSFNKVAERVALALLDGAAADGDMVRLTQSDLAAEVGTTREVVARCLASFQADGLIRLGRARITVLNREGLRRQL